MSLKLISILNQFGNDLPVILNSQALQRAAQIRVSCDAMQRIVKKNVYHLRFLNEFLA